MTKITGSGSESESGSGSISQRHGSPDPDPHQNVMDPQHWLLLSLPSLTLPGVVFRSISRVYLSAGEDPPLVVGGGGTGGRWRNAKDGEEPRLTAWRRTGDQEEWR